MKETSITRRLAQLGGAKWGIYLKAKKMLEEGNDIVSLAIGEPDVPTPSKLVDIAVTAIRNGRTTYADGQGEIGLRQALAEKYSVRSGRKISERQFLCFPGTQTTLFAVLMGVAETGDEVLVGDPMYATYESAIRAGGAGAVPVPLRPENGFRISAADIAARVTERSTAILLTTPHNPTGAILTRDDLLEIGALARRHDLWIISDEVYEDLVFDGQEFVSPLSVPELADRVIVTSSISKSHAAPGFRSGWCAGPEDFIRKLLPVAEAMLFGNQPFIADMTEAAIREGSSVAPGMRQRYARRARQLHDRLEAESPLRVHRPQAGMFAMIDVSGTGMSGDDYANDLLARGKVAVMPGSAFGTTIDKWVRIGLTTSDELFDVACDRIVDHAKCLALETT